MYAMHIVEVDPLTEHGVVLTATMIEDLPPVSRGFERIAQAADNAMHEVLIRDLAFEIEEGDDLS